MDIVFEKLVNLLTREEFEPKALRELTEALLADAESLYRELLDGYRSQGEAVPEGLTADDYLPAALGSFLDNSFVSDKADELHEEIQDYFDGAIPSVPRELFSGRELRLGDYFKWLAPLVLEVDGSVLLTADSVVDDNIYVISVRAEDVPAIIASPAAARARLGIASASG